MNLEEDAEENGKKERRWKRVKGRKEMKASKGQIPGYVYACMQDRRD